MKAARRRPILAILGILIGIPTGAVAVGSEIHQVIQVDRKFQTVAITIARGDLLRFANHDPYVHQIYVDARNLAFESDLQPPDQLVELRFPAAGVYQVMCHIHPTMRLTVTVK